MNESGKNPFDPFFDEIRNIVRQEIAAALNGNGHVGDSSGTAEEQKQRLHRSKLLASAKAAAEAGALLTAEQLAVMLQVNKATLYERVKKKAIPYHQAGRFIRFNLHEVLESQRKKENPS